LEVTVKGKATKLAIILARPSGPKQTETISEERMISNSATWETTLPWDEHYVEPGKYTLTVKTFSPEEVVCQQEFNLSLDKLEIKEVNCSLPLIPVRKMGGGKEITAFHLTKVEIDLEKKGNLPLWFTECTLNINGEEYNLHNIKTHSDGKAGLSGTCQWV
jgi:hypothetical protein